MTDDELREHLERWRNDPVQFVRNNFRVHPDDWQEEALTGFRDTKRLAMRASKGVGKTAVLCWLAWNFLATRKYAKIAATSVTADALSDTFWPEMAKWQARSPYLQGSFTWSKTRIVAKHSPENWFMSARTWPKSADQSKQADTLAGLHADYLLFILDESGGIPDSVAATAEAGLATGIETKIIQAGNPTHLEGPLYRACTSERHLWKVIEVSGDPDDPKRAKRVSIEWARQQIEKYGKDNPWVLVNVYGQFPPASINSLLSAQEVIDAMKRQVDGETISSSQKRIGVDVARFGDDRTVLFQRQGLMAYPPAELRQMRTTDIAARVIKVKSDWGSEMEFIDDTGHWGHGVIDNMITAGYSPMGIQFHGPAMDPRYKNRRAEMWISMSEWVKRGGCLPNLPELVGELTTPTYTFSNGKIQLEDKEQVKQRLGRSPDLADALALTFCLPEMPSGMDTILARKDSQQLETDWDPYAEPE